MRPLRGQHKQQPVAGGADPTSGEMIENRAQELPLDANSHQSRALGKNRTELLNVALQLRLRVAIFAVRFFKPRDGPKARRPVSVRQPVLVHLSVGLIPAAPWLHPSAAAPGSARFAAQVSAFPRPPRQHC
jgi:hypothetical protein